MKPTISNLINSTGYIRKSQVCYVQEWLCENAKKIIRYSHYIEGSYLRQTGINLSESIFASLQKGTIILDLLRECEEYFTRVSKMIPEDSRNAIQAQYALRHEANLIHQYFNPGE